MPIGPISGSFGGFWPIKLRNYCFDPQRYAIPAETRFEVLYIKTSSAVFCAGLLKNHCFKKLLGKRRKVIFHPYREEPPVIPKLKFAYGFPAQTWSFVPDVIFIAPIFFGTQTPKNWLFPLTCRVTFTTARALPSCAVILLLRTSITAVLATPLSTPDLNVRSRYTA